MFQEAFSQMLVKQMDPMNGVMQTMATNMVSVQGVELITTKAKAVSEVQSFLDAAKAATTPNQVVIDTYEKLLKQLSS